MDNVIEVEERVRLIEYLLVKENDESNVERESLQGQLKMAINNVTATLLKKNAIRGTYFKLSMFEGGF